jgi:hypothetical protein
MYSALAALAGELEVLDGVGLIRHLGVDVGIAERTREQSSGRTDERQALDVLLVAGLLTDQHHRRIRMAVTEDSLRGVLVQRTATAAACGSLQGIQSTILGQVSRRPGCRFGAHWPARLQLSPAP